MTSARTTSEIGPPKVVDQLLDVMELGIPLTTIADAMQSSAVMEGMHTVDVSLIVSPVIHEYILAAAQVEDINVKEHPVQKQDSDNETNEEVFKNILRKSIDEAAEKDAGTDLLEEVAEMLEDKPSPDEQAEMASGVEMVTD